MAESPLSRVRNHFKQLKRDRLSYEPYWRDVRDLIVPQRGRGLDARDDENNGQKYDSKRVNSTASRALGILASGMQSGLTSKARQWFLLANPDPDLNRYLPVRQWYDKVQEILEGIFRRSNCYTAFLHTYTEMAAFGQGAMEVLFHPDKSLYCRPRTVGSYYMSTDQWGEVDTYFITEKMTVRQIVLAYGKDNLPQRIKNLWDNGKYEDRFEVVNAFLKHPEDYGVTIGEQYSIASVHYLADAEDRDGFLRKSGFRSWPVMTPRWDVVGGDVYGWAPVRDVISDVRMLQRMESDALKGVAKSVNPPWRIPPELDRKGLNTQPGGLNVVSAMGDQAVAPLFTQQMNIQQLQMKINAVEQNIKEGLYNSLFLALLTQDNPQMTAREVAERHEEKLLMLGPVLERIHYEMLDPMIDRAFLIASEAGLIPPAPPELEGAPTQIEYVSILSQAQKAVGVNRIEQTAAFLGNMAAVYPELRHALDPYRALREYAQMIGAPGVMLRDEEEYQKSVSAEQQAQQQAQQVAVGGEMANAAKVLGDTDLANVQELLAGSLGGNVL